MYSESLKFPIFLFPTIEKVITPLLTKHHIFNIKFNLIKLKAISFVLLLDGNRLKAFLDCLIELSDIYSGPLSDADIQEEVDTFMFEVCVFYLIIIYFTIYV